MAGGNELAANVLAIKNAKAIDGKQTEFRIRGERGLTLRVEVSGRAAFYLRYSLDGAARRIRLGARDAISLADAIKRAGEIRGAVVKGVDPAAVAVAAKASLTLRELWEARIADPRTTLAHSTRTGIIILLKAYAFPQLGDRPSATITREAVASVLRPLESVGVASRLQSAISSTYTWAQGKGLAPLDFNPCRGLRFSAKSATRERVLTEAELVAVWRMTADDSAVGMTEPTRLAVRLLLLTGQRSSTITQAKKSWLVGMDGAVPCLVVPRGDMKDKRRGHEIPLTRETARLFRLARARGGAGDKMFWSGTDTLASAWSRSGTRWMTKTTAIEVSDAPHIHDLRRTFVSWAASQRDIRESVVRRITHHAGRDVHERVYDHSNPLDEMREALEKWESYILGLVSAAASGDGEGTAGNVVRLTARA